MPVADSQPRIALNRWNSWTLDWFGQPLMHPAKFRLAGTDGRLCFEVEAQKAPRCQALVAGTFQQGLWEYDVAELFLRWEGPGYLEFNLSPSGAWWCAEFSQYRERVREVQWSSLRTEASSDQASWRASFTLPLVDLPPLAQAWANPTCILEPQYLCFGHSSGGEPDFHRPQNFRRLAVDEP